MGCVQSTNILNIKNLKEMTHMENEKSRFWLDKKQRLWKVHKENDLNTITQQILNNQRLRELSNAEPFLLLPDKIIKIDDYHFGMRSPLAETDLFDILNRPFNIDIVAKGLENIRQAIHFLHSNGIAHRDIKTENIIIVNGRFKLIDFDFARQSKHFYLCGTKGYICPFHEEWSCSTSEKSERMDYYAFGVAIWHVFYQASIHKMIRSVPKNMDLFNQEMFTSSPWNELAAIALNCCKKIPMLK